MGIGERAKHVPHSRMVMHIEDTGEFGAKVVKTELLKRLHTTPKIKNNFTVLFMR